MCDQTFSLGTFYEDIYITSAHEGNIYICMRWNIHIRSKNKERVVKLL